MLMRKTVKLNISVLPVFKGVFKYNIQSLSCYIYNLLFKF